MSHSPRIVVFALIAGAFALAGCETSGLNMPGPAQPAAPAADLPLMPPSFPAQNLVGRWGLTAYHNEADRERTITAAAGQCRNPYVITMGPTGGVMMHLADQATPTELALKGAPGNKNFIGPKDEPPGGNSDREVVSFDGRVLTLRWMDPEVQSRYGTMVYVRCGAEGAKPKPKGKPRPSAAAPKPVQPPIQRQ
ncbi:MAG TPA: hypothetical protein VEJ40_03635 [Pseudolabrys sp.]|jgi:hypothetical protein|nr:hypothetical protein [Pseudolabrys sp.]